MTTIYRKDKACAVCGKMHGYTVLGSTNAFGSCDLDTRPPEMQRSTMNYWLEECPHCGYIAYNIAKPTDVNRDILQQESYVTCDGIAFQSNLAKRFYRYSMLKDSKMEKMMAYLHSAWVCDDVRDIENAIVCRKKAIQMADEILLESSEDDENLRIMKADMLRRTFQFDRLVEEYAEVKLSDDLLNQILVYEIKLANERDDTCHTVREATENKK